MSHRFPYKRNCRPSIDGLYHVASYIKRDDYAKSPQNYIRAFLLIQKDLLNLFDYVEPSEVNLCTYSYRILELFLRTCTEIEANFKAILIENDYPRKKKSYNIFDYRVLNKTHRLSSYEVFIPNWIGDHQTIRPFRAFIEGSTEVSPKWYRAYGDVKHNRSTKFEDASLLNLMESICGLIVLLSSQFFTEDFAFSDTLLLLDGPSDGMERAIGGFFRIKFPDDWPIEDRYDFSAMKDSNFECMTIPWDGLK